MKQTTLVQIAERLESLAGKLPEKIRHPVLRELTPLKQLFLQQRRPRFLFIGSSKTPMQKIIDLLFASADERVNVTVTAVHRWTDWTIPGQGTISILDARDAGDSVEAQIEEELRREPADLIFFFDDGESDLHKAIGVPVGQAKVVGLSLGSERQVTQMEEALDAQPDLRERLLAVVRITETSSAESRRLMSRTCGGIAERSEDRDDPHLARPPGAASRRADADKVDDRHLRRGRDATNSAGRHADPHVAASANGLRNHVHQWPRTKPPRCDRVHRRAGSKPRRWHASPRRGSCNAEVFSRLGQRRLWNGRRRRNVRDRSRGDSVLPRRRFLEGGATDILEEPQKAVAPSAANA